MKKFLATVFATMLVLTACGGKGTTNSDVIKIGANFELSGAVSSYGTAEMEGVKLAVDEINEAGGVLGKQIELVELDTKSDEAEAATNAMRLVTQDKVVAMVGPATTGAVKASIPATNKAKVPLVAPSATADDVTENDAGGIQEYIYRICFEDSFQGKVMAKFADGELDKKKAVIIGDNSSDYAKGLAAEFKAAFPGEIVAEESYSGNDTDFSAIITRVKGKDFDVMFIPGYYGQAGLIIKQAREAGITVPIIGGDGFDSPELTSLAGAANVNDVYFAAHYSSLNKSPKVEKFMESFEKMYGKEPNAFSALAYDSVYMLKDAIEKAGSEDPQEIAKALGETKDFSGVTGVITVDEKHNAVKTATVVELENGKEVSAVEVDA